MYDMNYYQRNFSRKMLAFLKYKYPDIKESARKKEFYKAYDKKYPNRDNDKEISIESSAKAWFSMNQSPTLERLTNICNLYNIDIEYFITKQKTFNKSNDAISKDLDGITTEVIERIKGYDDSTKALFNSLICCDDNPMSEDYMKEMLDIIYEYKCLKHSATTVSINNSSYKYNKIEDAHTVLKYKAVKSFEEILDMDTAIDNTVKIFENKSNIKKVASNTNKLIKSNQRKGKKFSDIAKENHIPSKE